MRVITTIIGIFLIHLLPGQNDWLVYAGLNHSNIIHTQDGQQILYNHVLNAPLWTFGFQLGVEKEFKLTKHIFYSLGTRIQLKGDKKSLYILFPVERFDDLRFVDFMIPINIKYNPLIDKDFFIKSGLSFNYLISQKKINEISGLFPIESFNDRLGLSGQIGFNFKITNKLSAEIMYSEGLSNIYTYVDISATNVSTKYTYRHQAFEFSAFYKL